jgi:hypothetical protein
MDSFQTQPSNPPIINLNTNNAQSELTSLYSNKIPTLSSNEAPIIKALEIVAIDAEYNLLVAQILREYKICIYSITFIKYNLYRPRKSRRKAWY